MIRHLMISALCASTAMAQWDDMPAEHIPGQAVVHAPHPQILDDLIESLELILGENTVTIIQEIPNIGVYTIAYPPEPDGNSEQEMRDVFDDMVDEGDLYFGEPVYVVDSAAGQTDSLWVSGLGIDYDGYLNQYGVDLLGLDDVSSFSKGQGVLIGVVDTGIDDTHPAITGFVSPFGANFVYQFQPPNDSSNGIDDDLDGLTDELAGHGTFITGLAHLAAPESRFLPVTVLNDDGVGTTNVVAQGIEYAVSQGAHVILLALGTEVRSNAIAAAVKYATFQGATVVAPVGNGNTLQCLFPAAETEVIAVGGSDHDDLFGDFSNYHPSIEICAPGSYRIDAGAPVPQHCVIGPRPGGGYWTAEGTSFSSAFSAGVAALVRAQHPEWPDNSNLLEDIWIEMTRLLSESTVDIVIASPVLSRPRVDAITATNPGPRAPIPGDLNGDNIVGSADLGLLLAAWESPLPTNGKLHLADINMDFAVGPRDLGLLLSLWSNAP